MPSNDGIDDNIIPIDTLQVCAIINIRHVTYTYIHVTESVYYYHDNRSLFSVL